MKVFAVLLMLMWSCLGAFAQELNCHVTVNSDKVPGTNKSVFASLEKALNEFMNQTHWTDMQYASQERIDCNMLITINTQSDEKTFSASLQVQSRRPIYNSTYYSSLLNWQDDNFDFEYIEMTPIEYVDNQFSDNLTATMAFYAYMIIGLDCDSYSPMGGTPYYEKAERLVNLAQSVGGKGWKAFADAHNRYAIINNFTDSNVKPLRNGLYDYHRVGLDLMWRDAEKARIGVIDGLRKVKETDKVRPQCVATTLFVNSKRDEVIALMSQATKDQKKEVYEIMSGLDLSQSDRYEVILK